MADLIDRQAALDSISAWRRDYPLDLQEPIDDCWNSVRELPAVEQELHWIPCSERLPEEGQKCLVCDKGSIGIDTYIGHGNPYNWKWYTRDYEAWQPLPDPYGGGDSE